MTNYSKIFFLLGVCSLVVLGCRSGGVRVGNTSDNTLSKDFDEYREIRLIKGHFQGGDWNAAVDRHGGKKHRLMMRLADHSVMHNWNTDQLTSHFGTPDEQLDAGTARFQQLAAQVKDSELVGAGNTLLIYYWRGTHDFLIFVVNNQQVLGFDWWHAGE